MREIILRNPIGEREELARRVPERSNTAYDPFTSSTYVEGPTTPMVSGGKKKLSRKYVLPWNDVWIVRTLSTAE